MKRFFLVAVLLAATAATSGCCSTKVKALADGVEAGYSEVLKEYEAYVIDGRQRPDFNENDKAIRRTSLRKVKDLLDEARK